MKISRPSLGNLDEAQFEPMMVSEDTTGEVS